MAGKKPIEGKKTLEQRLAEQEERIRELSRHSGSDVAAQIQALTESNAALVNRIAELEARGGTIELPEGPAPPPRARPEKKPSPPGEREAPAPTPPPPAPAPSSPEVEDDGRIWGGTRHYGKQGRS